MRGQEGLIHSINFILLLPHQSLVFFFVFIMELRCVRRLDSVHKFYALGFPVLHFLRSFLMLFLELLKILLLMVIKFIFTNRRINYI